MTIKRYLSVLLCSVIAVCGNVVSGSEMNHKTINSINYVDAPAKPDSLKGVLGKYFILKLVPADRNNNYYLDTVSILHEQIFGELEYLNDPSTPPRYIVSDPDYYRLFVPFTYYNSPVSRLSTVEKPTMGLCNDSSKKVRSTYLPIDELSLTKKSRADKVIDKALMAAYLSVPEKIVFTEDGIEKARQFAENLSVEERKAINNNKTTVIKTLTNEAVATLNEDPDVEIHKPSWWKINGSGSLQFSQLAVSDNWYKGGEGNSAMMGTFLINANYNDQKKLQWESLLDAKLGITSTPSDTVHDFLSTTDQLRIYTKLGYKAAKYWFYTMSAEFKTQFVHGYKANNRKMISSFLAPADVTLALGLDYKREKADVYQFSLFFAPLNWTMRYIGNDNVDVTAYGLKEGKKVDHKFGSQIQPTIKWNVAKNIVLNSRLDYLTSYEWVRIEWENTVNLMFNRYLSAKLFVHARYDDSSAPVKGKSHFQITELFSFGINYNW